MNWTLRVTAFSMKQCAWAIGSMVVILVMLPILAVASATNISALGLGSSGSKTNISLYSDPAVGGDTYDYGYCTYWVSLRRIQIGDPIPNNWGNAITWNTGAEADGYTVDHMPTYGSIMQWPEAPGGEGHVAFVESVDPNTGKWTISEMNAVGWDEVDYQTMPASAAAKYNFIHDIGNQGE